MSIADWSATVHPPCPDCARLRADLAAAQGEAIEVKLERGRLKGLIAGLEQRAEAAEEKLARAREALEEIAAKADHQIPLYAYGDHEAACAMAGLLDEIAASAGTPPAAPEPERDCRKCASPICPYPMGQQPRNGCDRYREPAPEPPAAEPERTDAIEMFYWRCDFVSPDGYRCVNPVRHSGEHVPSRPATPESK